MEMPVTSASFVRRAADGLLRPLTHSQTVGCFTPTRAAKVACDFPVSERYCLSLCIAQNIGQTDIVSTGRTYIGLRDSPHMPKTPGRSIWERIKEAMRDQGIHPTQKVAAKLIGVQQPSVSDWAHGAAPSLENAIALAKRLNICVEWIYTENGPKHPGPPEEPRAAALWSLWGQLSDDQQSEVIGFVKSEIAKTAPSTSKDRESGEALQRPPGPKRANGPS